jgi:two-component system LytT family response regulator
LDPQRFVRVHRSWVINIDRLQHLERSGKDNLTAVLSTHRQVPISRSGYERVKPFITP